MWSALNLPLLPIALFAYGERRIPLENVAIGASMFLVVQVLHAATHSRSSVAVWTDHDIVLADVDLLGRPRAAVAHLPLAVPQLLKQGWNFDVVMVGGRNVVVHRDQRPALTALGIDRAG